MTINGKEEIRNANIEIEIHGGYKREKSSISIKPISETVITTYDIYDTLNRTFIIESFNSIICQ